jgi:transcription initiation factor TFIIB
MPAKFQACILIEKVVKVINCPECGGSNLIRDHEAGELVCEGCGFVISSALLDHGPEWREFREEQGKRRSRVGSPLTLTIHDRGMSTVIDWRDKDIHGRRLNPMKRAQLYRMRKWDRRSKVSGNKQRNLAYALSEMTKSAYKLKLPRSVLETASMIYRSSIRKRLTRGRSIQGIAAASIYMACRQCKVIRTLEEVANAANISKKNQARNYRFLLRKLKAKVPPIDHEEYVSRLIGKLELSGDVEKVAIEILENARELKLTGGRAPAGIAAATTYIACLLMKETRTQGEIAKEANVTEVTIRNRYKELIDELDIKVKL